MTDSFTFFPADQSFLHSHTSIRSGETRLGQMVHAYSTETPCRYVILGIEESVGPALNLGLPGAENGFQAFLKRFLNMQSTPYLSGADIMIAGTITYAKADTSEELSIEALDNLTESVLYPFVSQGITPIVIGGGHNNALPIIRTISKVKSSKLGIINMDPHGDCRSTEKRHSGNSFSFGIQENLISYYTVIGLHPQYNNTYILDFIKENRCGFTLFDDYILGKRDLLTDLYNEKSHLESLDHYGIELDLDAIEGMPSSAFTPSGFTLNEARLYLKTLAHSKKCRYLHLPEGAPRTEQEEKIVGKALAYLAWDFIYEHQKAATNPSK
jgi:formiminoglutamase